MTRVFQARELIVTTPDETGMLARITSPIAEARVNVNACFAVTEGKNASFHFLTSDNQKAVLALTKAGFKTTERDVVVVETHNEIGSLAKAASQLAEAKVNLDSCYATASSQGNTWIVFGTNTIEKALNAIS
jgi:hypothetical protein